MVRLRTPEFRGKVTCLLEGIAVEDTQADKGRRTKHKKLCLFHSKNLVEEKHYG